MTQTKDWHLTPCPLPCQTSAEHARRRQAELTKPLGSLGYLEDIASQFAAWQATEQPRLDKLFVRVFAGDHGVCAQQISAFPQEVTMQMVLNFLHGGAAISVLSKQHEADFAVVNMGLATPLPAVDQVLHHPQLINMDIAAGTQDFSHTPAMTSKQLDQALLAGRSVVQEHIKQQGSAELFIGGEMGIGNTSSASAIYCALLGITAKQACGPGTGLKTEAVAHKAKVIEHALILHDFSNTAHQEHNVYEVLRKLGGLEIAGLVGAYIAAAQQKVPSLVDGFISTAAALVAVRLNPSCRDWLLFSHQSAEPAHAIALERLQAKTLLDIGMRLGEGSGAAVSIPLLQSALALHQKMATFSEATVFTSIVTEKQS